jgi:hypothetical protein
MPIVTDVKWKDKSGNDKEGYYMDGYLLENIYPVKDFIKKDWDFNCIVAGSAQTRVGKSSIGFQIGYFTAWRISGGEMNIERDPDTKKFINCVVTKKPNKKVMFSLNNLVFSPEELMKKGRELPKNSVIVYDEGRQGLDSKSSMTSVNRLLEDYFQECGVYNHVLIIILPDFFKLHPDYAVSRTHFLVNVYHDENFERGYFNFYNRLAKEKLYEFGKRRLGITSKYMAATPNFYGKFTSWIPFDKEEYDKVKKLALKKKELNRRTVAMKYQRDGLMYMYYNETGITHKEVAERMSEVLRKKVGVDTIHDSLQDYAEYIKRRKELEELQDGQEEDGDLDK